MTGITLVILFGWPIFPSCYVEGAGLTPFKKISEYVISLILIGALALLFKNRSSFDKEVFRLLSASIILTIGAELAFTFYVSVYGFSNLVGHFFKLISFYLIYRAIIRTGLKEPYRLLFRNIKQNEEELSRLYTRLHLTMRAAGEGLWEWNLKNDEVHFDAVALSMLGYTPEDVTGDLKKRRWWMARVHPDDQKDMEAKFNAFISRAADHYRAEFRLKAKTGDYVYVASDGEILTRDSDGTPEVVIGAHRNITDRKEAERRIAETSALLKSVILQAPFAIHILKGDKNNMEVVIENDESARIMGESTQGRSGINADMPEMLIAPVLQRRWQSRDSLESNAQSEGV